MTTKAYSYNEAERELARDKELSRLEVINFITNPTNKEEEGTIAWNKKEAEIEKALNNEGYCQIYNKESKEAEEIVKATGAYPYNSLVAEKLLDILGLNDIKNYKKRAEHIVYGTNRHYRHIKDIELYQKYWNDGYISIQDITNEDNGKKALLTGVVEGDLFAHKKVDEKVRLVCDNNHLGYQTKGQSRKYHMASTNDLFIKIIA